MSSDLGPSNRDLTKIQIFLKFVYLILEFVKIGGLVYLLFAIYSKYDSFISYLPYDITYINIFFYLAFLLILIHLIASIISAIKRINGDVYIYLLIYLNSLTLFFSILPLLFFIPSLVLFLLLLSILIPILSYFNHVKTNVFILNEKYRLSLVYIVLVVIILISLIVISNMAINAHTEAMCAAGNAAYEILEDCGYNSYIN